MSRSLAGVEMAPSPEIPWPSWSVTVLRQVASRLRAALREPDLPARLGGDEFAVLLDPVDPVDATSTVADRLSTAVGVPIGVEAGTVTVAASVGSAVFGIAGTTPQKLLASADAAMYKAKRAQQARAAPMGQPPRRSPFRAEAPQQSGRDVTGSAHGAPVAVEGLDAVSTFAPPTDADAPSSDAQ